MLTSHPWKAGLLGLWLMILVLLPASACAGAAAPLSQTSPQGLMAPPVDLRVPPPMDVRVPPPMDLRFQTMDLQFTIEDVKGAVQALAMKETPTEVKIELSGFQTGGRSR